MIDLHAHVLPGIDDGPATIEGSLEMLRDAAADGITAIACTPHVRDDYPTSASSMEAALAVVRAAAGDIPIEVLSGGELALDRVTSLSDDELRRFGLGGNAGVVLIESPYSGWPLDLGAITFALAARGVSVVLAHPERNPEVQERPELLDPLVERGVLVQLTAASVDGRLGRRPRDSARRLLERGTAHLLASDAHAASVREGRLAAAADSVGDARLARWLTDDVPRAVVEGSPVPDRPRGSRRRAWWRW
jgi:protein-tyrosine phosphatase